MATATTNTEALRPSFLANIGGAILTFFEEISKANKRQAKIEYLQSLSDEELAARGLTRDRIVHYVFQDVMYV